MINSTLKTALTFSLVALLAIGNTALAGIPSANEHAVGASAIAADVHLMVDRSGSEVIMNLYIDDLSGYKSVVIERSDEAFDSYRQIKFIDGKDLSREVSNVLNEVDKYPLPASQTAFYRVTAIDDNGVVRMYPAVQLVGIGK